MKLNINMTWWWWWWWRCSTCMTKVRSQVFLEYGSCIVSLSPALYPVLVHNAQMLEEHCMLLLPLYLKKKSKTLTEKIQQLGVYQTFIFNRKKIVIISRSDQMFSHIKHFLGTIVTYHAKSLLNLDLQGLAKQLQGTDTPRSPSRTWLQRGLEWPVIVDSPVYLTIQKYLWPISDKRALKCSHHI